MPQFRAYGCSWPNMTSATRQQSGNTRTALTAIDHQGTEFVSVQKHDEVDRFAAMEVTGRLSIRKRCFKARRFFFV
jgi:hypothetical protein